MGINWRSAMPLLSTLAALVIIVHSAEEDLDREHRYDLRPRVLDTRPPDHTQPWRVARADPAVQQHQQQAVPQESWNDESQDDPPVRRRVGRKRKRRPPSPESYEIEHTEVPEENHKAVEVEDRETRLKRRRKPKRNPQNNESMESPKPIRRRSQRRRRPSLETWPELSEFGSYPKSKKISEGDRETLIQTDLDDDDIENQRYSHRSYENDNDEIEVRNQNRRPVSDARFVIGDENRKPYRDPITADKSLSEFSMELMGPVTDADEYNYKEIKDKMKDKSPEVFYTVDKAKEEGPIDPVTLKDILKRSNGTSLSEILQQHNLTLADLLNGNENAISLLKSQKSLQNSGKPDLSTDKSEEKSDSKNKSINKYKTATMVVEKDEPETEIKEEVSSTNLDRNSDESSLNKDIKFNNSSLNEGLRPTLQSVSKVKDDLVSTKQEVSTQRLTLPEETPIKMKLSTPAPKMQQRTSGMVARRPLQGTIRRKLRMRPIVNNTYKSQINRDLMALSARRYVHHNRRNVTKAKAKEWKEMIPIMPMVNITKELNEQNISTTTISVPEETTTANYDELIDTTVSQEPITINNVSQDVNVGENKETTTIAVEILATELDMDVTKSPIVEKPTFTKPAINPSGVRRQSYNNRLKKKRIKHKTSTTEAPQDDIMKNFLELGDLVSSSEFIARTQIPKATSMDDRTESATELEDFLTTHAMTGMRPTRVPSARKSFKSTTVTKSPLLSSTEETAKIEIEEILNDTRTSAKLSKILRERNMTLTELLEHRERGSSHVHLADIFHNASREPNPPEPFLSKSLLEPISKETYPLRALLDANSHDPTLKATTLDPISSNHINIPVIMDFGNNVNENAENMGIMSLFHNFTKNTMAISDEKSTLQKDSKGIPYKSTITTVNATDDDDDTTRESRMLDNDEDMISWNEIFSMIRKNHKNETRDLEEITNEISPSGTHKKITVAEDVDGDGVIVLEDLHNLKDLNSKAASGSEEQIEFNTLERAEIIEPGILNKPPSSAKSVTVATASIVGLAMILFLLTYAALKWRQQRTISHKKTFCDERIPSPVFENRKGTKNCSSRSISPMLPTSNIYTMNTLESQNGKDSPEYMWDTLRKPFQ